MARHSPCRTNGRARLFGGRLARDHGDVGPAAGAGAEAHAAFDQREQGVIAAHADVPAGMPARPALADDDVAGHDALAAEFLDPEALARRVAPVPRAAACLLMRHLRSPSPAPAGSSGD